MTRMSAHPMRTALILATALALGSTAHAAGNTEPERVARWAELSSLIFDDALIAESPAIGLEAPKRALDSALVPVTLTTDPTDAVRELTLVIDENPGPVAAAIAFGPAGDARRFGLRVRIDGYTNVHAVAKTGAGEMLENAVFVKGAGGCSAPIGISDKQALASMGEMRFKTAPAAGPDGLTQATLMIRHPNFNGMQMNQLTLLITPSRYITRIAVTRGTESVFDMTSDISLATDPVLDFLIQPGTGPLAVTVEDSEGGSWTKSFDLPPTTN